MFIFFCKHKTAYEMRMMDCSSDVCSSDLPGADKNLGVNFPVIPSSPAHHPPAWHVSDRLQATNRRRILQLQHKPGLACPRYLFNICCHSPAGLRSEERSVLTACVGKCRSVG